MGLQKTDFLYGKLVVGLAINIDEGDILIFRNVTVHGATFISFGLSFPRFIMRE